MSLYMSSSVSDFPVGRIVTFQSIHGDFPINGMTAKILEVDLIPSLSSDFPQGVGFCIQFIETSKITWCRIDEIS